LHIGQLFVVSISFIPLYVTGDKQCPQLRSRKHARIKGYYFEFLY